MEETIDVTGTVEGEERTEVFPVDAFVTHPQPHASDQGAILLAQAHGEEVCPGVTTAPIFYFPGGTREDLDKFLEGLVRKHGFRKEFIRCIGVGGGDLDEHAVDGNAPKEGKCEMLLMAEQLGCDQEPALQTLLRYVTIEDQTAYNEYVDDVLARCNVASGHGEQIAILVEALKDLVATIKVIGVANTIKLRYDHDPNVAADHDDVASDLLVNTMAPLIRKSLEARYIPVAVENEVTKTTVKDAKGKAHVVATVKSDYPGLASYLLSHFGGHASIAIVKSPTNRCVRILAPKRAKGALENMLRIMRFRIRKAKGFKGHLPISKLGAEGTLDDVPELHYHKSALAIYHGTPKHPDIPFRYPLDWSREKWESIAQEALSGAFEPFFAEQCKENICAGHKCRIFCYGLVQCRTVQYRGMQKAAAKTETVPEAVTNHS